MNKHVDTAEKIGHPLLVQACMKHCPAGFLPFRQYVLVKQFDHLRKKLRETYGKGNIHLVSGHFQIFKEESVLKAVHFKNGATFYLRAGIVETTKEHPRKRMFHAGREIEAGPPDWTRGCSACGDKPVVPQTGLCGPCTFGESITANGNW